MKRTATTLGRTMHRMCVVSVCMIAALLAACSAPRTAAEDSTVSVNALRALSDVPLSKGEGRLPVDGGRMWYRVSGADTGTPLILVHAGPGMPSYYLRSLEQLGNVRPVVRYDQMGAGKSEELTDTSKMRVTRFVADLEALRASLGYNKVHLLGHGWGATIVAEYYHAHPEHVASLTFASPFLDASAWSAREQTLVRLLPDSMQKAIAKAAGSNNFASPAYANATAGFYNRYIWLRPNGAEIDSMMRQLKTSVAAYMLGPGDYTVSGSLKQYSAVRYLWGISVPTLYTVGTSDLSGIANAQRFASMTAGARVVIIPGAAFTTSWDNAPAMNAAVREHLANADRAAGAMAAR